MIRKALAEGSHELVRCVKLHALVSRDRPGLNEHAAPQLSDLIVPLGCPDHAVQVVLVGVGGPRPPDVLDIETVLLLATERVAPISLHVISEHGEMNVAEM